MRVFKQLDELPIFHKAVITIGTFDGVHLAHRQIIARVGELARTIGGESVLITFHPHPRMVVGNGGSVGLLTPLPEKLALLQQTGLQQVVVIPFTTDFAQQTPEAYINDFLYRYFNPAYIVIGYDHRYGKNRQGGLELLQQFSTSLHYQVEEISQQLIQDIAISSSKIRQALTDGNIGTATSLLGYSYQLSGKVIYGKQLGRTIGFPTANLSLNDPDKLLPAKGVYAVTAQIDTESYRGILNIGNRPTVNGQGVTIETHLLDFPPDKSLYGQEITLTLHQYLRKEQKFDSLAALTKQLTLDKQTAVKLKVNSEK